MIDVVELYDDFVKDDANSDENGTITYSMYNRLLWRAQLRLMGWLTGNFDESNPPEKISTQKCRDLLSKFITKLPKQVNDGIIPKPDDYYSFRDLYKLKGVPKDCPDEYEEDAIDVIKFPIELLDNSKFTERESTFIKRLKPLVKPIAKLSEEGDFEFSPKDIGSVVVEYYRYPVKAKIVTVHDNTYNEEVPDNNASTHLEWPEGARQYLLHFLSQLFSIHTREVQFQQQNDAVKP